MASAIPFERVLIVGTGLLGTSIGLGLREAGVTVSLMDRSPSRAELAADYGAGVLRSESDPEPDLVVVATPPDVTAGVVAEHLRTFLSAIVIDVASVKQDIVEDLVSQVVDHSRYIPTHPMAGRERGGPTAARVDLFVGRPWIMCPTDQTTREAVQRVEALIRHLGASPHQLSPMEHDRAVAAISHLPQLVSSVLAGTLSNVPEETLGLAGSGIRDVTRIASSDPELWRQIISHNAVIVAPLLEQVGSRIVELSQALSNLGQPGGLRTLAGVLEAGVEGVSRLPGKHGGSDRFAVLVVVIDDRPGQIAALLGDVGTLGVNVEDMTLEHSPGAPVGFVQLQVQPAVVEGLERDLVERGWRIAGEAS